MFAISLLQRAFAPILRALYGRASIAPDVLADTLCQHSRHTRSPRHGFATLDALEPRQLLSSATLSFNAACIRLSPNDANDVQVFDSAFPCDTDIPDHTYSRSALTSLVIDGTAGADTLVVDYSNGSPLQNNVLIYNAGAGADNLVLVGRPDYRATIRPSQASAYSGCVTGYLQSFVYSDVQSISASSFSDVTVISPNTADDITLNRISAGVAEISGSSGGTQFHIPNVSISDTPKIILDLAYYDDSTGADKVTLTGVADPSDFSYTLINYGSGTNTLIASAAGSGSTVQLTGPAIDASVSANCELNFISNQTLGKLSLGDGARVAMVPDTFRELCLNSLVMADSASLQLKGGNLVLGVADQPADTTAVPGSLLIGSAAILDLGAGFMVVNYDPAGTNPIAQIQQDITDAYNPAGGGFWDGTRGLGSSAALYDAVAHGIGYADNFNQLYTHWGPDSQPVTDYSILARYTWLGDANLDGGVNVADLSVILPNYGATSGANWEMGDFNYDGSVDVADLSVMLPNMGRGDNAGLTFNGQSASTDVKFNDGKDASVDQDITISLDWDGQGDAVTSWLIYWMDGAAPQVINSGSLAHVTATHRYTAQGNYPIIAIAQTGGLDHFVGSGSLTVGQADPDTITVTATPADTNPVDEGTLYSLTLDAPEGITMWTIDWGDGMTENIAGPDATPSHDYKTAPTGPIYATATDDTNVYDADPVFPDLLPIAPTLLTGAAISGQQVTLSWTDNSGIEDGFLIEQAEGADDFTAIAFADSDAESITLPGPFDPSVAYHFRVSALSGSTLSDPTNTLDLSSPAVPNYPTDLTALANSQTQITLAWTDHAADDEPYSLQRSGDNGANWTTIALDDHATDYVDTGLNSGTRYLYRIFASNTAGNSGYAAAELDTLPAVPGSLTATPVSFRRIDLDWADTPGNDIAGYYIYRDTTDDFTPADGNLIDTAGESSYSDTTVTAGNTYYYKIVAISGDGVASAASAQASAAPLSAAPAASGGSSVVEGATYTLTLSPNANPATGWSIYWGDGATSTPAATDTSATHTFTGQADTRDILVRYEDADGILDLAPITVGITNAAPAASITGDATLNEGSWYTLNLAATDPGQNAIASWSINWGDGPTGQPDIQTIYGNPSTLQHFYAAHGAYTITATATDSRGGTSANATLAITAADVAPTLSVIAPTSFPDLGTYRIDLSATDPGHDAFDWLINWGDGSSVETVASTAGYAEHNFTGSASSYTMTFGTQGTPMGTTMPAAATAARGAEQTQYYRIDLVGGAGDPYYGDTTDLASSSIKLLQEYDALDNNHDGLYQECERFAGTSDLAYVPIGSDIIQSVKDAMEGTVVVNCEGNNPVKGTLTFIWPNDHANGSGSAPGFQFSVSTHHDGNGNDDGYTVTYALHVDDCGSDGDIWWHQKADVTGTMVVKPIQITQSANECVTEGQNSDVGFSFGRTNSVGGLQGQYTTTYKVGGNAVYGQRYTFEPDTSVPSSARLSFTPPGNGGLMTVTFPAGVLSGRLIVVPVNDNTPQWTQRVTVTLADPNVSLAQGQANPALMEIRDDNDLQVNMPAGTMLANYDDDDQNGILDYKESNVPGERDLYEATVDYPDPDKAYPGCQLTFSVSPDMAAVWDSPQKLIQYLGPKAGWSYTWTAGSYNGRVPLPKTVFIEALHGGTIYLQVQSNEYGAQATPALMYPQANTEGNPGKALRVQILNNGLEQPDGGWKVLVGERINASLLVEDALNTPWYHWMTPPGKPFLTYNVSASRGELIPLPNDECFYNSSSFSFYWADSGVGRDLQAVVVADGKETTAKCRFNVVTPTCSGTMDGGKARMFLTGRGTMFPGVGLYNKNNLLVKDWGVFSKATVTLGPEWSPGEWCFVQLVDPDCLVQSTEETWVTKPSLKDTFSLDNWWPYPYISKDPLNGGPQPSIWTTDSGEHGVGDTPEMRFGQDPEQFRWKSAGNFKTFVMFKPSGDSSAWVPVLVASWSYAAEAERANGRYTLITGQQQIPTDYVRTTDHPVWNAAAMNGDLLQRIIRRPH